MPGPKRSVVTCVTFAAAIACGCGTSASTTVKPGEDDAADETPAPPTSGKASLDANSSSGTTTPGIGLDAAAIVPVGDKDAGTGGSLRDTASAVAVSDARATSADARGPDPIGGAGPYTGGAVPYACKSLFCENFETTAPGALPTLWHKQGNATVGAELAFSGMKALHIPPYIGKAAHMMRSSLLPASLSKAHFGRLFIRFEQIPTAPPSSGTFHWTFTHIGSPTMEMFMGGVTQTKGDLQFYLNSSPGNLVKQIKQSANIAAKTWHCFEWSYDQVASSARFWYDDAELTGLAVDKWAEFPVMTSFAFGFNEFHETTTPWEIWMDDIAMDGKRVGCAR